MIEIIKALGVGVVCGIIFTLFKLPLPAPPVFAGIVWIIGIFVGFLIIEWIRKLLGS